jgi:hypothetical protein
MLNGTIIHGRIMDFDNPSELRDVSFNANFLKGGKHHFSAVMFAGTVGIYTGMKPNAFSIEIN